MRCRLRTIQILRRAATTADSRMRTNRGGARPRFKSATSGKAGGMKERMAQSHTALRAINRLSLGERENSPLAFSKTQRGFCSTNFPNNRGYRRCSLSPWERVRVRGSGAAIPTIGPFRELLNWASPPAVSEVSRNDYEIRLKTTSCPRPFLESAVAGHVRKWVCSPGSVLGSVQHSTMREKA